MLLVTGGSNDSNDHLSSTEVTVWQTNCSIVKFEWWCLCLCLPQYWLETKNLKKLHKQVASTLLYMQYFFVVWVVKYVFYLVEQLNTRWRSTPLDPRLSGGRWRAEIFQHQGEVYEPLWWRTPSSSPAAWTATGTSSAQCSCGTQLVKPGKKLATWQWPGNS